MLIALAAGSALLYVASTYAMKEWGSLGPFLGAAMLAACFVGAAWLEIEALQRDRLGYVFILIIGFECLLALLFACLFLRETHNWAELAGMALIVLGVMLTQFKAGAATA